jgi:uncharacterized protein (DUF4213/DUF364 family)
VYFPPENRHNRKSRKFGLVVLQDNSTGFFFTLLPDARQSVTLDALPKRPIEMARLFLSQDLNDRAIGLGAINAISQFFFKQCKFNPPDALNPLGNFDFKKSDHVGMVGFFPALVKKLRKQQIPLTVIELDKQLVQQDEEFTVTLDVSQLAQCNKILCTASTLINDTVDEILNHCKAAEQVALLGPSTGCFPDPLFEKGISVIGGSVVNDYALLEQRCNDDIDWSGTVTKYALTKDTYPGFKALAQGIKL